MKPFSYPGNTHQDHGCYFCAFLVSWAISDSKLHHPQRTFKLLPHRPKAATQLKKRKKKKEKTYPPCFRWFPSLRSEISHLGVETAPALLASPFATRAPVSRAPESKSHSPDHTASPASLSGHLWGDTAQTENTSCFSEHRWEHSPSLPPPTP